MRKVWQLFCWDLRHITGNVIAGIVCVGMIIVPSLYAWFNIAGSWDPYANTKNLQVAVANEDRGFQSDLLPVSVNVGERVTAALRENDSIGWQIVGKEDALEGVRSGRYYAAIVIPPEFSADLLGALDPDAPRPTLTFYSNEKENAIANVVTDKASGAVRTQIDTAFAQTVSSVGATTLSNIGRYLDGDQLSDFAQKLDGRIEGSVQALRRNAQGVAAYGQLVGSVKTLLQGTDAMLEGGHDGGQDLSAPLTKAAGGVRDAAGALSAVDSVANDALDKGAGSLDAVAGKVDAAFSKASDGASTLADGLDGAAGTAEERKQAAATLQKGFDDQAKALDGLRSALESSIGADAPTQQQKAALDALNAAVLAAERASADLGQAAATLGDLGDALHKTAADLRDGTADVSAARDKADGLLSGARKSLADAKAGYEGKLGGSLGALADAIDGAAEDAEGLGASLAGTLSSVRETGAGVAEDLSAMEGSLDEAAKKLDASADELQGLSDKIGAALASGDMETLRTVLSGDPATLAGFLSAPVELERKPVFPVANNGSAMAPFYSTLALWVGAIVLVVLVKVEPSERQLAAVGGAKLWQQYLGRLGVFLVLGLLQATLLCAGDLWFLRIQCENPWLMFLGCWATSFVDVNIMYALVMAAGDVGKALAVVLLVMQVAGSGGSFPPEMLPPAFQAVYPFLPFVQSIASMRGAVAGVYQADYLHAILSLLGFLGPALLLGLVLRRPVIRLNHWIEHQLESTRVM